MKYSLPVPGHDNTDTTTSDVTETNVESTELVTDDEEHAEGLLRVLDFWQEVRSETEGQRDLRGLVEVGLQDMPRKNNSRQFNEETE